MEVQADSKSWQKTVMELWPRGGWVGWRWGCGVLARVVKRMGGPELRVINGFPESSSSARVLGLGIQSC